jgi:hypothetical protein
MNGCSFEICLRDVRWQERTVVGRVDVNAELLQHSTSFGGLPSASCNDVMGSALSRPFETDLLEILAERPRRGR